jgi:uncharacterized protein
MTIIGIYHKDCIDGTAAAAVLLRKFPDAKVFPLQHVHYAHSSEGLQEVLNAAQEGSEVYTVDCGLGAKEFLAAGYKVVTIDHHIGAKELFENLEKEYLNYSYIFDNDKSGASLTWKYFFPDEDEPEFIKYVEDADLWKWQYGDNTKDVNNYLSMFKDEPEAMKKLLESELSDIQGKGKIISKYADKVIARLVKTPSITVKIGAHEVPAYNITIVGYESACGNILSEQLDVAVMLFTIQGDQVRLSFRSKKHHKPTSLELAHLLGGGGHKNAAGADISLKDFLTMII